MEHTQGKWEVQKLNHIDGELWLQIGVGGRGPICDIIGEKPFAPHRPMKWQGIAGFKFLVTPDKEQLANAERICKCVNEWDELQAELKLYRESRNYPEIIKLTKQREDLLEALEKILKQGQEQRRRIKERLQGTGESKRWLDKPRTIEKIAEQAIARARKQMK